MKTTKLVIVLTLVSPFSYAASVDDRIKLLCGTHPVLSYLRDYKGTLMDPQILTQAEECAKGVVKADVWKWKLADVEVQGCLQKKYGHEQDYIKSIASQFEEAKEMVSQQIQPYNMCAINVRNCGKTNCMEPSSTPQSEKPSYAIFNKWGNPVLDYGTFATDSECLDKLFVAQKRTDLKNAAKCKRLSAKMWCLSTKDLGAKSVNKKCHQSKNGCLKSLELDETEVELGGERVMTSCEQIQWYEL